MAEDGLGLFAKLPRKLRNDIYKLVLHVGSFYLKPEGGQGNQKLSKLPMYPALHLELLGVSSDINKEAAPILYGHNSFVLPALAIPLFMDGFLDQIGKSNTSYLRELTFRFRRSEIWLIAQHELCDMYLTRYDAVWDLRHLERLSFSQELDDLCIDYSEYDLRCEPSVDISILSLVLYSMVDYFPKLSTPIYLDLNSQVSVLAEDVRSTYVEKYGLVPLEGSELSFKQLDYCLHKHSPCEGWHCKVIKLNEDVDPVKDQISEYSMVVYQHYEIRHST
ncbi:MAG: hypothetical protein Q9187_009302 [Circinaria calcarea]